MDNIQVLLKYSLLLSIIVTIPGADNFLNNLLEDEGVVKERPKIGCQPGKVGLSEKVCYNFPHIFVTEINKQINKELEASYVYLAMASHFARDEVAYPGFSKFFKKASDEEKEHAQMFIDYLILRGGKFHPKNIDKPKDTNWTPIESIDKAIDLEKAVTDSIMDLHWLASNKYDPHLTNFLEENFITEQLEAIKKLGTWYTVLSRLDGDHLGIHIFDMELFEEKRI